MGRINVNYIIHILKRRVLGFLPYKVRKPFILLFSILGLIAYYKAMLSISAILFSHPSTYLLCFGDIVVSIYNNVKAGVGNQALVIGGIFIMLILTYKYCVVEKKKEDKQDKDKTYKAKSWYYQINTVISLLYSVITILTFIPLIEIIGGK